MKKSLKEVFENLYESAESSKKDVVEDAKEILNKTSKTPVKWANVFNCINNFRTNLQSKDKQDETATDSQVAFVVPLIATFVMVLETDVMMTDNAKEIIINQCASLFKNQQQIENLKEFIKTLDIEISNDTEIESKEEKE